MSFFENASNMEFNNNEFTLIQGDVTSYNLQTLPTGIHPPAPIQPSLTHIYKKSVVLKWNGPSLEAAAFVKGSSKIVAVSSENPTVVIWDLAVEASLETPICYQLLDDERYVAEFVKISTDGSKVLLGPCTYKEADEYGIYRSKGDEGGAFIWDMATKTISSDSFGDSNKIVYAALSSDGSKVIASSFWKLRLWDTMGGNKTNVSAGGGSIFPVALSADGKKFVSIGQYGRRIDLWETPNEKTLEFESNLQSDYKNVYDKSIAKAVAVSPQGTLVALGFEDGKILLIDGETGDLKSQLDQFQGHDYWITKVVFSGDGKWIVSSSRDGSIRVWDVDSGQPISKPLKGHQGAVISVVLSPDERELVSVGSEGKVMVWTLQ